MPIPYTTVGDLVSSLRAVGDHTRPPFEVEILSALNFGYKECVRAISSVRTEFFTAYVNSFTLPAKTREIDVSLLDPPLWRPTRLLIPNIGGRNTAILFRYRAVHGQDHEAAELSPNSGTFQTVLYDILSGVIPGVVQNTTMNQPSGQPLTVADTSAFPPGTMVTIPINGLAPLPDAPPLAPTPAGNRPYYGYVVQRSANQLFFHPPIPTGVQTPIATPITQLRRLVLRIANPMMQDYTGQLWYQFRPPNWVNYDEVVDPLVAEHRDLVIYYALSQYLSAVNDTEASNWLQKAQLLKSELMQDLEPLSGQNSEALDSALWGLD